MVYSGALFFLVTMKNVNRLLALLFLVINICKGSEPAQICHLKPKLHTDACMAVKSLKSKHERGHNLLMTFSVKFHHGSGWVAFGVGDVMDRALMFVLWPGDKEGGELPVRKSFKLHTLT